MKRKQTRKGMTLIEIVISLAIAAVLSLLLVEIMSCVNSTMRMTDYLNRRLADEAKYADNLVTIDDSGHEFDNIDTNLTISQPENGFPDITASGKEYTLRYNGNEQVAVDLKTNYRFMVFNKENSNHPTPNSIFKIFIVANSSTPIDELTQIKVSGAYKYSEVQKLKNGTITEADLIAGGVVSNDIITSADIDFSLCRNKGATIIELYVPGDPPSGSASVQVVMYKNMRTDKGTLQTNVDFNTANLTYCTRAQRPSGTFQYYSDVYYGFDGRGYKSANKPSDL